MKVLTLETICDFSSDRSLRLFLLLCHFVSEGDNLISHVYLLDKSKLIKDSDFLSLILLGIISFPVFHLMMIASQTVNMLQGQILESLLRLFTW